MKQKEVIWTILGALILSECLFGLTVDAEQNVKGQNLLIWEFAPYCKNGLEYVVLKNTGHAISLNGYSLSDGEGTILFGNVEIPAYSCLVIANNASAYYDYFGKMPDLETKNGNEITVKGLFKLANVNDEIYLYAPDNSLVDVVGYGEERVLDGWNGSLLKKPSQGTVYRRTSMKDTDTVQDWIATKVGRTSMHPARFSSVNVTAFVTPDCGLEPVLARIENATREILVASYTLDSPDIVYALENASKRNVTINVLFEGAPAGGLSAAEKSMLSKLSAFANLISYGVPEHTRYNYMHAKYMVIDGQWSVVSTENYKATSYTEQGLCGNRGWGAIVESPGFARQLATMFWQDVKNVYGDTSIPGMLPASYAARKELNLTLSNFTTKTSVANVTLLAAPDNALDYLLRTLAGVKESVVVEALDLPLYWEHRVNPFVEAFVNLSERGVSVRVLLDGSASNSKGNRETVGYLNSLNANISAKLIDAKGHGYRMLHTKGFVIDKAYVYLGSTNFCENSFDENREVGVFIESREIGEYFLEAFEFDWLEDVQKPRAWIGMPSKVVAGTPVRFDGSASFDNGKIVAYLWDFNGDGVFERSGAVVNHTFGEPGKYRITLKVVDACGNENWTSREISVCSAEKVQGEENQTWIYFTIPVVLAILVCWKLGCVERKLKGFLRWLRFRL